MVDPRLGEIETVVVREASSWELSTKQRLLGKMMIHSCVHDNIPFESDSCWVHRILTVFYSDNLSQYQYLGYEVNPH